MHGSTLVYIHIGRRMSIQKMLRKRIPLHPRGTTYFSHESIDKNLLYQNPLLPKRNGAQLGKIFLQSLILSRYEIFEPPLFW